VTISQRDEDSDRLTPVPLSIDEAEAVLSGAVGAYRAALGERFVAAYALGSLAHGGYSPLVSDIDLGLIVEDPTRPEDPERIQAVADCERAKGSSLSERLSVFWGTPSTLRGEQPGGRFPPLDRLDLIENGRLLAGTNARLDLSRPSAEELLISGAEFALDSLAGARAAAEPGAAGLGSLRAVAEDAVREIRRPELLLARGVRRVTKTVLFPVRFLFTAATGDVGTNDAAAAWYLADREVPSATLVAAALSWRAGAPVDDEAATELLGEQLVPLYVHYIDDHIRRLDAVGRAELAHAFEEWRRRLAP
jgi:predicted nucleotidyltransferase